MNSTIPQDTAVSAAVNDPGPVTLYAMDGEAIQVAPDKVDSWLQRGFSRTVADPEATLGRLLAALDAVKVPAREFVDGVTSDGHIDTGDTAALVTFQAAIEAVGTAAALLYNDIARRYPVRQGEATTLRRKNEDGTFSEIAVDPGQVDLYTQEGWKRA